MYQSYFGLTERPFSIAPDPQYLYMSTRHKEAMAHLSYGLSQGGCFIVLTGEVGTGKTTLCRNLLQELPENIDVALILNANINEQELLQTICDELKIIYKPENSQKQLLDLINQYLLATFADNRHTVLIIDEAQLLSRDVLEQIRLLTNLETTKAKLLQIILIGQPELNDLLSRNDLRQLSQRVTARYHLGALQRSEIEDYVNFRLSVAGCKQPLFSRQALNRLHTVTDGIPRRINVLADHALLATYSKTQAMVDAKTVKAAAKDVFITKKTATSSSPLRLLRSKWSWVVTGLVLLNLGLWWFFSPAPAVTNSGSKNTPTSSRVENTNPPSGKDTTERENSAELAAPSKVDDAAAPAQLPSVTIQTDPSRTPGVVQISDQFLDGSDTGTLTSIPAGESIEKKSASNSGLQSNQSTAYSQLAPLLETSSDLTGRVSAFKSLAKIWQRQLPETLLQPICSAIETQSLRCLGFSDWSQLLSFNRPAIIVLNHNEQLHRAVVSSIDGDNASLVVGDQRMSVSLAELRSRWVNRGVIFWQPSDVGDTLLRLGDQSAQLPAVRRLLNTALANVNLPLLNSLENPTFDIDMSQKVFTLQSRFSISGDSRIGNETYLLINELTQADLPPVLVQRFFKVTN